MLICCADIRGLDASRARLSGRKNTAGSAFARSLLLFAAAGGAGAMYGMMRAVRHKTLHRKFMIGLPALLALHILAIVALHILLL